MLDFVNLTEPTALPLSRTQYLTAQYKATFLEPGEYDYEFWVENNGALGTPISNIISGQVVVSCETGSTRSGDMCVINNFNITYDLGSGTVTPENATGYLYSGASQEIELTEPTYPIYTVTWSGNGVDVIDPATSTGTKTFS
jgi:hypothetical protein